MGAKPTGTPAEITANQPAGRSGAQLGAALGTAACNDLAAADSCHAGTEAVTTLANKITGLKRTFHGKISKIFKFPVLSGSDA